jgi:hypothetical protein
MLVVDLHCVSGHQFEGWFASADDLASQQARGLLSCPVCGDHDVVRRPSAPHLNTSGLKEPSSRQREPQGQPAASGSAPSGVAMATTQPGAVEPASRAPVPQALQVLQAAYLQAVRHIVQHTEDVGERFAEEARSMHLGEAPNRPIRGQASAADKQALREEGIEVLSLPVPDGLDGAVH